MTALQEMFINGNKSVQTYIANLLKIIKCKFQISALLKFYKSLQEGN